MRIAPIFSVVVLAFLGLAFSQGRADTPPADNKDWPTYNYDVIGTRHNFGERALTRDNVAKLEVKWQFPPEGSTDKIGAIHATPAVVNGYVYFGTATMPAVYKLPPDGKVKWVYRNPDHAGGGLLSAPPGFLNSVLVAGTRVYATDLAGWIYALDRATGQERWKINTRVVPFPGAHTSNCIFTAPVVADGKLIIGGGGFEHAIGANPKHKCCTGRGFVVALEPESGKVVWKYDVGPEPKPLDPPVRIKDDWGEHVFYFGPSTSSVWCTPSYDAATGTIFFGTDTHNAPRQPTKDDPRLYTIHSCAMIAVDARTGAEKWITQINPGDVWNYGLRPWDSKTGLYKDQSIGDTPKIYEIQHHGAATRVIGFGCKNGGFYVLNMATGKIIQHTPVYTGPPKNPPSPPPDARTLALPGPIGGLQTGCATDGKAIYTNGIDKQPIATPGDAGGLGHPPTGGRVVSISLDATDENWRHERPRVAAIGGTKEKPAFSNVGDPVGSGIALANGVGYFTTTVSNKLVALNTADGRVLKEIDLGPVWCGPSVSRGRVYVGTGNILFSPLNPREAFFPKRGTGILYSFGLPGADEVTAMGAGNE